jgi:hypothetical protein
MVGEDLKKAGEDLRKAIDDAEADECKKNMKKFVSKKEHDEIVGKLNENISIINSKEWKTRKRLASHLFWTYGIFWTLLWIIISVAHFFAGAYQFFYHEIESDGTVVPSVIESPYPVSTYYFIILWIALFFVYVFAWWIGLKMIDDSVNEED